MALLDITQLLSDPDFYDTFYYQQRPTVIATSGSTQGAPTETDGPLILARGVVMHGKQSRILSADGSRVTAFIEIWTQAPVSAGYKIDDANFRSPDFVYWKGRKYLVAVQKDYTDWGNGFFYIEADLVTVSPLATTPQPLGTPL